MPNSAGVLDGSGPGLDCGQASRIVVVLEVVQPQELSKIGSSATVGAGMAHGVLTAVAVRAPGEQHTMPPSTPRRDWASGTWWLRTAAQL